MLILAVMLPIRISSYLIFLNLILIFLLSKSTRDYIVQFWFLDLSMTDSIIQGYYSIFKLELRFPSCMLRSYLLVLKLKVTSITVRCRMLRDFLVCHSQHFFFCRYLWGWDFLQLLFSHMPK